jgi:hypothetical protein
MPADPAESPPAEPIPVNTSYLEAAQEGRVIYIAREEPRPPGGDDGRGYGDDVSFD